MLRVVHCGGISVFSANVIKSSLPGYDSDYLFDWTILKYQQMQQQKTQTQPIVSNFFPSSVILKAILKQLLLISTQSPSPFSPFLLIFHYIIKPSFSILTYNLSQ